MSDGQLAPNSTADMKTTHNARIGLITDLHWNDEDEEALERYMDDVVEHFNTTNVDFVVCLGDLITEDDTTGGSLDRLYTVRSYYDQINAPVYDIAGNHDVMNVPLSAFYNQSLGETLWDTFNITDSITGVLLDTSSPEYPDARGKLGQDQIDALDTILSDSEQVVIFSHHPLYYHELTEDSWMPHHPEVAFCSDKYLVNDLLEEHGNVIATINGHTHLSNHSMYLDIPRFTINAFNYEKPAHTEPNGSFAVMEVSQTRVRLMSHKHGEYDSFNEIKYPTGNKHVALGGTFDPVHDGHKQMFQRAFEIGDVAIGLTSDSLASQTRHTERYVKPFTERKKALKEKLDRLSSMYGNEYTIKELNDPFGVVGTSTDITHLIVSPETFSRGEAVNEKRLENGLNPLSIEIVDPVLAEDGKRISSTRIVKGEINEHGAIVDSEPIDD